MAASFTELLKKIKKLAKSEIEWHFHVLPPDCKFNKFKGKFCILVENEETGREFFSLFKAKPLKESKKLVKLAYKKGFLKKKKNKKITNKIRKIEERAKQLSKAGINWHHHHLTPNCKFNASKGSHFLMLEDRLKNRVLKARLANPETDLNGIERLFYKK